MAVAKSIFQPVGGGEQHVARLNALFVEEWITDLVVASAFSNSAGVRAVSAALAKVAKRTRAFVGVRNGSTTAQAMASLLKLGVKLYGVDTATRSRIFHPKLFLASGDERSRAIIGSANLTHAGLHNNIEAGVDLELDHNVAADKTLLENYLTGFEDLIDGHPEHCFEITSGRQIVDLMRQGLLEDERNPRTQTSSGASKQTSGPTKPPIKLPFTGTPKKKRRKIATRQALPAGAGTIAPDLELIWESKPLKRRSLGIPTRPGSNPTGSTTLGTGTFHGINRVTYFRDDLFGHLDWTLEGTTETASQGVDLVIAGVLVGTFQMTFRHSLTRAAAEAADHNSPTSLSWNEARSLVAREDLLDRTMRIWRSSSDRTKVQIEID
ncbi:phospholipase D family protein [uncultured Erythrobacter sp.]|uniref:phospholipase D family protein n=1 Tax=uncultured Erythrobacter sp. TaxID=263913 RepID=UPI00261DE788|nr:phospholipase D family protein [uncultured Erythrobacter sp.]